MRFGAACSRSLLATGGAAHAQRSGTPTGGTAVTRYGCAYYEAQGQGMINARLMYGTLPREAEDISRAELQTLREECDAGLIAPPDVFEFLKRFLNTFL